MQEEYFLKKKYVFVSALELHTSLKFLLVFFS